jgi:hypothetical protein
MASLEGVKVGDTLLLFTRTGGRREKEQTPQEVTVVKVGTKLVHIPRHEKNPEYGTHTYRVENGYRNDDARYTQLMTREAYEDSKKREDLWERLGKHGLTGNMRGKLSTEALEAVVEVLDGFKKRESA